MRTACVELGQLAVPGMRTKVRWYPGGPRRQKLWRAPSNILRLCIVVGEPVLLRNVSDGCAEFRPADPLMFWPRSTVWESRTNGSNILAVSSYFDGELAPPDHGLEAKGISIDDFSMLEMMQALHDEARTPGHASSELVEAIGSVLRIKLGRLLGQAQSRRGRAAQPRGSDIGMIDDLIRAQSGSTPSIAQLAALCHTTRRSLLRRVRRATGKSTSRYIAETQLGRAKTLLAASNMTLQQIAYETGYPTPSSFSSKFKSMTGMTPSAFRKRYAERRAGPPNGRSG